ncbi:MAG: peptidoglycan DD-metalloendopeptidase family protein [bacterium]|nr:peptidoglycan DD-metalloendopeptidase family protein [bacterium]
MATTVGNLRLWLTVDRSQYSKELDAARKEGQSAANQLGGLFEGAGSAMMGAARVGVAAFAGLTAGAIAYSVANAKTYVQAEQFQFALGLVGQQMGYTNEQIDAQIRAMTGLGASTTTARDTVMQLMRSRLDASRATELYARAEDIAVTTGRTGNEVIQGLIHGITTQNALVLRNAGVTIDADKAMRDYAASLGKSVGQLSANEKQQAYFNAVMAETTNIAGVSQRMMAELAFNWEALKAPMSDVAITAGSLTEPALTVVGRALFFLAGAFAEASQPGGALRPIIDAVREAARAAGQPIAELIGWLTGFIKSLNVEQTTRFADALKGWLPVLGPLVGAMVTFGASASRDMLGPLGRFVPSINPVIGALVGLAVTSPEVQRAFIQLGGELAKAGAGILQALMPALQALIPAFVEIIKALVPIIPGIAQMAAIVVQILAPALHGVAQVISWVAQGFGWLGQELPGVGQVLGVVALAIAGVVAGTKAWAAIQIVLGPILTGVQAGMAAYSAGLTLQTSIAAGATAANMGLAASFLLAAWPVLAVVAALAILGAAFVLLYKHCEPFRNIVNALWEGLKAFGGWIMSALKPVFDLLGAAIGFLIEHWKAFAMILLITTGPIGWLTGAIIWLVTHFDLVSDAVGRLVGWLADRLGPVFAWVARVMSPVVDFLAGVLGPAFQWVADNILPIFANAFQQHVAVVLTVLGWIGGAVHKVVDFFQWLFDMLIGASIIPDLVNGIVGWFGALPGMVGSALSGLWGAVTGAFWAVVGAVGGVMSALWSAVVNGFWAIVGAVSGVMQGLFGAVTSVMSSLWSWLTGTLAGMGQTFYAAWSWIWSAVSGVLSGIWGTITSIFSAIGSWLSSTLSSIGQTFYAAWSWIWSTVSSIASGIWSTIVAIFTTIWGWLTSVMSWISTMFSTAWSWIWNTITTIVTGIWSTIVSVFTTIWNWIVWVMNTIAQFFNTIWTWIKDNTIGRVQEMWQWVTDRFWAFVNWVTPFLIEHANWLNWLWNSIKDNTIGRVQEMWQGVTSWVNSMKETVQNVFYGMRDTVVHILQQMLNWVIDRLNWVIDRINGFINLINKGLGWAGVSIPNIENIPNVQFAVGGYWTGVEGGPGVVSRPTLWNGYLSGEEYQPETIIPWNPRYRGRARALWELTGEKLGLFGQPDIGVPGCKNCIPGFQHGGTWWDGNWPMVQGPGGAFSHANLAPSWDYAMPNGTVIRMGLPGEVIPGPGGGYGTSLGVNLDQGGSVVLGHLQSITKMGRADVGEEIARSDNTGFSTGPHLHIEFRNTSLTPGSGGPGGSGQQQTLQGMIEAWARQIIEQFRPEDAQLQPIEKAPFRGMYSKIITDSIPGAVKHLIAQFGSRLGNLARNAVGLLTGGRRGNVTQEELFRYMEECGFNADRTWAARVVNCESSWQSDIIGPQWNGDGGSIGLWQIQPGAHPQFDRESLKDPKTNTCAAADVYRRQGPGAWSCKAMGDLVGVPGVNLFDRGGMLVGPGALPFNASGRPEMVLNERTYTRLVGALERLEQHLSGDARAAQEVTFNQEFNDVGTTAQEVVSDVLIALRHT